VAKSRGPCDRVVPPAPGISEGRLGPPKRLTVHVKACSDAVPRQSVRRALASFRAAGLIRRLDRVGPSPPFRGWCGAREPAASGAPG